MPVMGIREEFELQTRDRFTKVKCELGIKIDGRELPSMAIVGSAMEEAIKVIQNEVTRLYTAVPERTGMQPDPGLNKQQPSPTMP